jgi:hypothetical protein
VRDCLRKTGVGLGEPFDNFVSRIESSIALFRAAELEGKSSVARDALRDIALDDDPSPAMLRARLKSLPRQALEHLTRRGRIIIPRAFPNEVTDELPFETPDQFLRWLQSVPPKTLVPALRLLSSNGGGWVQGRSRAVANVLRPGSSRGFSARSAVCQGARLRADGRVKTCGACW